MDLVRNVCNFNHNRPLRLYDTTDKSCDINENLITSRIQKIALVSLVTFLGCLVLLTEIPAMASFAFVGAVISGTVLVTLPLTSYIYRLYENRVANKKAVQDFLKATPCASARRRVLGNLKLVQSLNLNDLNKLELNYFDLINNPKYNHKPLGLNVFKYLIDSNVNVLYNINFNSSILNGAVRSTNPAYLEHLLKTKKVTPNDLTNDQQFKLWLIVGCAESASLLNQYGFDVNVINTLGYTPLQRLSDTKAELSSINPDSFEEVSSLMARDRILSILEHVKILIDCGATKQQVLQ
jgi:hypothetical protein